MSNNARVVPACDGGFGEIGAAQYFQALAARRRAVGGHESGAAQARARHGAARWCCKARSRPHLTPAALARAQRRTWPSAARGSFLRLRARHELLVIEGAGSPAEINLADARLRQPRRGALGPAAGDFRCLLVADIDRGGAFAHLLRHLGRCWPTT